MKNNDKNIAILIPCYNESQTIAKVIRDFKKALPKARIYVYDNNSTDGTAKIAEEVEAIVRYESRQGKGNVMRTMFREIDADCYLITDGDDTYPAESAEEMCNLVLINNADMVIGNRLVTTYFSENKRPFHNFGNSLVQKCINFLWNENIQNIIHCTENVPLDIMTGYRALSPLFVKTFPILSKGFEIETEMTIHALNNNMLIANVPVQYRDRPLGSVSKLNTISDGCKVMMTILNLYKTYRPLHLFGIIAIILSLISIGMFIPVLVEYFDTGVVPRFPTLIVSGFMMIAALLSLACGLVLDTNAVNERKNFELQMNLLVMQLKIMQNTKNSI